MVHVSATFVLEMLSGPYRGIFCHFKYFGLDLINKYVSIPRFVAILNQATRDV